MLGWVKRVGKKSGTVITAPVRIPVQATRRKVRDVIAARIFRGAGVWCGTFAAVHGGATGNDAEAVAGLVTALGLMAYRLVNAWGDDTPNLTRFVRYAAMALAAVIAAAGMVPEAATASFLEALLPGVLSHEEALKLVGTLGGGALVLGRVIQQWRKDD